MTAVYPCDCKHPKVRHQGGTYWCLTPDCACKRYTPDFRADLITGAAQGPVVGEPGDSVLGESTSARLRRVEQERDQANDLTDKIAAELRLVTKERDSLARRCAVRFEETQALKAELASARTELERLRYSGWIVARDSSRQCGGCEQQIRRGESYTVNTVGDQLRHVYCPTEEATHG